jgi:hypothetical protein
MPHELRVSIKYNSSFDVAFLYVENARKSVRNTTTKSPARSFAHKLQAPLFDTASAFDISLA